MKKVLLAILAVLVIGAVAAVVTCPEKQKHKEAIMAVVNEKIHEELQTDNEDLLELNAVFGSLGSGIASKIVDNRLKVKNHFLWSTGEIKDLKGEYQQISVGVFGHIFTFNKEDLDKAIDDAL